jgi:hypothetical protein
MRTNIGAIYTALKSRINIMPSQEYIACRSFLDSLLHATTHARLE